MSQGANKEQWEPTRSKGASKEPREPAMSQRVRSQEAVMSQRGRDEPGTLEPARSQGANKEPGSQQ